MFSPEKMKRARLRRGEQIGHEVSISKLATQIGSDRALVSGWENGRREPTVASLVKLADALECSIEDLVLRGEDRVRATTLSLPGQRSEPAPALP